MTFAIWICWFVTFSCSSTCFIATEASKVICLSHPTITSHDDWSSCSCFIVISQLYFRIVVWSYRSVVIMPKCCQPAFVHCPSCLSCLLFQHFVKKNLTPVRFRLTRMGTCPHVTDLLLDATGPLQPLHTRVLEAGCEVNPSWKLGCPSSGVHLGAGGSVEHGTSFNLRHVGVPNEGCKTHNYVYVVCSTLMIYISFSQVTYRFTQLPQSRRCNWQEW